MLLRSRHLLWAVLLCTTAMAACDQGDGPKPTVEHPSYCPDTDGPVVRGRVFVPDFSSADAPGGDAGPQGAGGRRETPARDVEVVVYHHGDTSEPIAAATTDAKGRWCVASPEQIELGTGLIAEATFDGTSYRRSLVARYGQIVSVRSEALFRVLVDRVDRLETIPPALYLNLHSIASTGADLIDPVRWSEGETLGSAVDRVRTNLMEDERFTKGLERLEAARR